MFLFRDVDFCQFVSMYIPPFLVYPACGGNLWCRRLQARQGGQVVGATVAAIILLIFVFVIIPMAAFKTIRKIRRGQNRPFVQGRDCYSCGGWGMVSSPQGQVTCNACGGRRTR
jgi:hypothetical protein